MEDQAIEALDAAVLGAAPAGPVVMLNLLAFRDRSADGDGSGRDAYQRYSRAVMPLIRAQGGAVIWAGDVHGAAFGATPEGSWDFAVLVQYPNTAAFEAMIRSPDYQRANHDRTNGLNRHVIWLTQSTFSRLAEQGKSNG